MVNKMTKILLMAILILTTGLNQIFAGVKTQADTVKVQATSSIPFIDGLANDECWNLADWQSIDQVWMPYNVFIDSSDYSGQYKILWSAATNLLYFLVEVHDDVFVDGFVFTNSNESYNYDIIEVFIDQDKSGGLHIFDGTPGGGLGTNAENAFSYHIAADLPEKGTVNTNFVALDFDGTNWSTSVTKNYADHFPEFAFRENEGKYYWEFSLKVYDDTYETDKAVTSRVTLQEGDIMGLSLAYCDNDNPDETPKQRDNFFGSVFVEHADSNNHWMNADDYGAIKLVNSITSVGEVHKTREINEINVYPNPAAGQLNYSLQNNQQGDVNLKIYNIIGQKVLEFSTNKRAEILKNSIRVNSLPSGIYFMSFEINNKIFTKRFSVFRN